MNAQEIALWQEIQRRVDCRPDGIPGGNTARAVAKALGIRPEIIQAPDTGKRQWPRESEMAAFYGPPGTGLKQIVPPYPLYYAGKRVPTITVNWRIADSVLRVLTEVRGIYGEEEIQRLKLDVYDGCFNNRPKRGGTSLSTHAYAAALDFCAAENPLKANHTTALFAKPEYRPWWEAWEREGFVSLGRARDFDWMHVQAARL